MRRRISLLTALVGTGLLLAAGAQAQTTERVSVASDGTQANRSSFDPAISADGRFVAFQSDSSNLVAGDTNVWTDIFVHDRDTGITERVSVASDGTQANSPSFDPAISADGRFVAFQSDSSNLVAGDTGHIAGHDEPLNIFVHDRDTGITERVSVASDGTQANSSSFDPAISADGRFVAFRSKASNLVPGDANFADDIFVHDRDTGITERVSVASDGTEGNDRSNRAQLTISANGRLVAFESEASNLVAGDTNASPDIFVHDRVTGTTERLSVASDGSQGNFSSDDSAISADGRFVAFQSFARNLVPSDTNGWPDVFIHDRVTGTTERVTMAGDGTEGNQFSFDPAISADGRFVAFGSDASNLVSGDTNVSPDIFVHDRVTGSTERVSVAGDGTQGNSDSRIPAISGDGRFVAFDSLAGNLVLGDTNGESDVFVRDRGLPPQLSLVGVCPGSVSLSLESATPNGSVAFGWGTSEGSVTLPPGPCAGTRIGLADPNPLGALSADQAGEISLNQVVNAGVCGLLLQALDVTTCAPSNVASVPTAH